MNKLHRTEIICITEFTTNVPNFIMHIFHIDFVLLNIKYNFVECYQIILVSLDFYYKDKQLLNFTNDVPQKKEIHTGLE